MIFSINIVKWKPLTYINYEYTIFGNMIGWFLALASMIWVPGFFIYYVVAAEKKGTLRQVSSLDHHLTFTNFIVIIFLFIKIRMKNKAYSIKCEIFPSEATTLL